MYAADVGVLRLAVHLSAVGDADDIHQAVAIIDQVHDTVVADPNPISLCAFQFNGPLRAGFFFESEELCSNSFGSSEGKFCPTQPQL